MSFVIVQTILVGGLFVAFFGKLGAWLFLPSPAVLWAGGAVLAASLVIVLAAVRALGARTRIGPQPAAGARLVDRGIYARLRHPMYTSAALASIAFVLLRPTIGVAAFALAVIVFYLIKARYEEGILLAHFPGYAEYRARTRGVLLEKGRRASR